jgi:hypothetical protein
MPGYPLPIFEAYFRRLTPSKSHVFRKLENEAEFTRERLTSRPRNVILIALCEEPFKLESGR